MSLSEQSVIILLDDPFLLTTEQKLLTRCLRNCVHALRGYAYAKKKHLSIAFATLSSDAQYDVAQTLSFSNFDSFCVDDKLVPAYFNTCGFSALNYYFSMLPNKTANLPLVLVLHGKAVDSQQNYIRLCSLSQFVHSKKVLAFKSDWETVHKLIYSPKSLPFADAVLKLSSFVQSASQKKIFKPLLIALGSVLVLSIALMLVVPRVKSIHNPFEVFKPVVYKSVYTGDGDRLILRDAPSRSGLELLRLNEGEVLKVLEENIADAENELWDKVVYHGFEGYVHTEYLSEGTEENYEITNPDTMYTYGKALLQNNLEDEHDGYYWIQTAADSGEITAQWEMFKFYDNGAFPKIEKDPDKALEYLLAIDSNENPYEQEEALYCKNKAAEVEASGNNELVEKYKAKAAKKESDVKVVRRSAAKKLSQWYFSSNIDLASEYYKKALSYGLEGDGDYMYSLAIGTELNETESLEWLKKASALGHYNSTDVLATYYWNQNIYDEALKWFKEATKLTNSAEPSYYCGWIYYHQYKNYSSAFSYFYKAYQSYDYTDEFYRACYYLGWCYEYGQGTYESDYYALDFYNLARGHVSNADEAYNRVYNRLYGGSSWW